MNEPSVFYAVVENVINNWAALQLALQHGMGGPDGLAKKEWLIGAVEQYFTDNNGLEVDEVEDFLTDVLNDEFDAVADDGSVHEIAVNFCNFYQLYRNNQTDELLKLLPLLPRLHLKESHQEKVNQNGTPETNESTEPTGSNGEQLPAKSENDEAMEVDQEDEGWKTINRSRRKFAK